MLKGVGEWGPVAVLNPPPPSPGGTPYAEILPLDLYSQLLGGMRMPKPMHCAQEVYDIIRLCWEKLPIDRLSFATLHERLDTLSHSKVVGGVGISV